MSQFEDLILKSNLQKQPQRLLFLFAKSTSMLKDGQTSYQSGVINPVMCVDKLPSELTSFAQLVEEADSYSHLWNFIFVSSFSGSNGKVPSSDDASVYLERMTNDLLTGKDLSKYIVWNRNQETIIIS